MGRVRGRQGIDILGQDPDPFGHRKGSGVEQIGSLKAIVFDFDGLIADTETPEYETWCDEFRSHGVELSLDEWIKCVGAGPTVWDVFDHLESLVGTRLDRDTVQANRRRRFADATSGMTPMVGVCELIDSAYAEGLPCAIASSSTSDWVHYYLDRFEIRSKFDAVVTRDMVDNPKPAPDLFLRACEELYVSVDSVIAFEDSVNGVTAAKAAGLFCVAVPNTITRQFDLSHADLIVDSLVNVNVQTLRAELARARSQALS